MALPFPRRPGQAGSQRLAVEPTRPGAASSTSICARDLVVRFLPGFDGMSTRSVISWSAPGWGSAFSKQVASITHDADQERSLSIARITNAIFRSSSVCGIVTSKVPWKEAQARLAKEGEPSRPISHGVGWTIRAAHRREKKRMAVVVPIGLVIILFLLYSAFDSMNALLVLSTVPFALVGGYSPCNHFHTNFSISAAVGVISTLGVSILGGVLLISRIEEFRLTGADASGGRSEGPMCGCVRFSCGDVGRGHWAVAGRTREQALDRRRKPLALVVVGRDADAQRH